MSDIVEKLSKDISEEWKDSSASAVICAYEQDLHEAKAEIESCDDGITDAKNLADLIVEYICWSEIGEVIRRDDVGELLQILNDIHHFPARLLRQSPLRKRNPAIVSILVDALHHSQRLCFNVPKMSTRPKTIRSLEICIRAPAGDRLIPSRPSRFGNRGRSQNA